jgi:NitT/TauT family transport system substrate-binding protein
MRIKLAENFRAVFYAPFYAARELGCYEREGVEVELIGSPAPAFAASGLLDGTIDLSWGGPMRVMKARDTEPSSDLVCFCEVATRDPFFLVGRTQGSEFRLSDLPKLKFAKVTEVPTPWLCLQLDLREQGVDPARLNCAAGSTMLSNLEKLRSGELDVVQMFEPYASLAVKAGAGEILYAASTRGPTSYTTFLATRNGTERNRDAFLAMTRGIQQMQRWLAAHSAESPLDFTRRLLRISSRPRWDAIAMPECGVTRPPCRAADSRGSRKACFPAVSSRAGRYTRTVSIRACAETRSAAHGRRSGYFCPMIQTRV